jgi:predicted MFS family arabinose efflux permease
MHQATIVMIFLFAVSGFTIVYSIRTRHIERMTRIEHGMDEENQNAIFQSFITLGIFLCSLSFGLFSSYVVSRATGLPDHILIPGFLLLFGGIGLILIAIYNMKIKIKK